MISKIALDADKDLQDLVIVFLGFGLAFGTVFSLLYSQFSLLEWKCLLHSIVYSAL